jgi:heterotetrameric sarcosine oxidase gamma subunit
VLDLGPRWSPPPDWATARITRRGLEVRPLADPRQVMLTGDLGAALAALCPAARLKGPHDPTPTEPYAIRIGADRALLVAATLDHVEPGHSAWHAAGFAATDLGAAMLVLALEGPEAPALLARGTGVDLMASPPPSGGSAAMLIAGVRAIAYRHGEGLRLHVDRPQAPYLWRWLQTAETALDGG